MSKRIIEYNKNVNYQLLFNKNEFINNNKSIIKDIKDIINEKDTKNKIMNLIKIYNMMNYNNYIIGEIEINEEDKNKDIRIINSYEQYKKEVKLISI